MSAAELGSVFFSVKEKSFDDRGNRRRADREFSKKAELETEMARQRQECVYLLSYVSVSVLTVGQQDKAEGGGRGSERQDIDGICSEACGSGDT